MFKAIHRRVQAFRLLRDAAAARWLAFRLALTGRIPIAGASGVSQDFQSWMTILMAVVPQSLSAGANTSAAIDADPLAECCLLVKVGALTGTIDCKVQQCATSGGQYADVPGASIVQIAAGSTAVVKNFKRSQRFLKTITTVTTGPALVDVSIVGQKKIM
jgi:hypothetical protein